MVLYLLILERGGGGGGSKKVPRKEYDLQEACDIEVGYQVRPFET